MVCYLSNTPEAPPMQTWDDRQPIYQQLADLLAAQLLDGEPPEGAAMPSVRALAGRYLLNPLTVNRALQALGDEGLLENRRGLGLYVVAGARERLRRAERERFLAAEWPRLRDRLRRLGLGPTDLDWGGSTPHRAQEGAR
jgi:GntR family transcriptional regulator